MKKYILLLALALFIVGRGEMAVGGVVSKRVASKIANVVTSRVAPLAVAGALCLSLVGCEMQQRMLPDFTASDNPANNIAPKNKDDGSVGAITPAVPDDPPPPPLLTQSGAWANLDGRLASGTLEDADAYLPNDRFTTVIDIGYSENIAGSSATFTIDLGVGANRETLTVKSGNFTTVGLFDLSYASEGNVGFGRHGGSLATVSDRLGGLGYGEPLTSLFIRGDLTNDRLMVIYIEPDVDGERLIYVTYASRTAFSFLGQPAAQHFAFRGTLTDAN